MSSLSEVAEDQPAAVPRHVAFIMDGNGRWATRQGMPRTAGHVRGVERLREIAKASYHWGVEVMTCYAFSTENWNRPGYEVQVLMNLFRRYMLREIDEMETRGVRVRFIGQLDRFSEEIQRLARQTEERTAHNDRMTVQIAVSYGARAEIADMTRRLAAAAARGEIDPASIDEQAVTEALWTAGVPDPDLVIRTSGEVRVSNFLLWQAAYAEYAFVEECWPDFTRDRYAEVLNDFAQRDRRFGGVKAPTVSESATGTDGGR